MDALNQDYKDVTFDAEKIQEVLEDGKGLETVREVLDKLG